MWVGRDFAVQTDVASCAVALMTQVYQGVRRSCLRYQMNGLYQDVHGSAAEFQCVMTQRLKMMARGNSLCELAGVSSRRCSDYQA